jgi:hypothetical protein
MVKLSQVILAVLFWASASTVVADDDSSFFQQYVKYDKNSVSLSFSNLRATDATYLILSTTGVSITLPNSSQKKTVTLKLDGAKLDEAVNSLLGALEINNSFSLYDHDGRLTQVIALEKAAHPHVTQADSQKETSKTNFRDLTAAEQNSILRDFARWKELTDEEQRSIHERLKTIPPSRTRDQIIREYIRQVLQLVDPDEESPSGSPVSFVAAIPTGSKFQVQSSKSLTFLEPSLP